MTITNDNGRLGKKGIERMDAEAKRFKQQDEAVRKKVEAKNGFKSYSQSMKNTLNDEKIGDKVSAEDRSIIEGMDQE